MRWRKILIGSVLGGLLGFCGFFVVDFFCWKSNGETMAFYLGCTINVDLDRIKKGHKPQGVVLLHEAALLYWLMNRGELAGRTAVIVAFLGASSMFAAEKLREKRQPLKTVTVS
jgi:hypothetical protein